MMNKILEKLHNPRWVAHAILITVEILAIPGVMWWGWEHTRPAKTAAERQAAFDAVLVSFDANGGVCEDNCRVIKMGETYGEAMNLYASEDERYFLRSSFVGIRGNELRANTRGVCDHKVFLNHFNTNLIVTAAVGLKWTYVVDVDSLEGDYANWAVGQTDKSAKSQLSYGCIGSGLKSGDKKFLTLVGQDPKGCTMLDRAFIQINPGQQLKAKWHVSLFAGSAINAENYHYVEPGETLECPLPVPARPGYTFLGWYDGDQKIEASTKVTRKDAHTLKAKWQKN